MPPQQMPHSGPPFETAFESSPTVRPVHMDDLVRITTQVIRPLDQVVEFFFFVDRHNLLPVYAFWHAVKHPVYVFS
jgi:hypothetical protein